MALTRNFAIPQELHPFFGLVEADNIISKTLHLLLLHYLQPPKINHNTKQLEDEKVTLFIQLTQFLMACAQVVYINKSKSKHIIKFKSRNQSNKITIIRTILFN